MPQIRISGRGSRSSISAKACAIDDARRGIVPAVEPDVGARRRKIDERTGFQPLHARRPVGVDEPGLDRLRRRARCRSAGAPRPRGRRSPPDARREVLAAAGRAGRGRPGRPAARARRRPCIPCHGGRAARPRRFASTSIIASACSFCGATMPGAPRFRMPAFSAAMPARSVPRNSAWSWLIEAIDRGERTARRRWWRRSARRARPRAGR